MRKKDIKKIDYFKKIKKEHWIIIVLAAVFIAIAVFSVIKGSASFMKETSGITTEEDYVRYSHEYNKDNVYGEEQTPNMENYPSENFENIPIACWGDEICIAPSNYVPSFSAFISRNTSRIVFNMAIANCSLESMGGRQGGLPIYVMPCDIPAKKSSVEVALRNDYRDDLKLDFSKNAGLNPCSVNGITGVISEFDGTLKFTRDKSGFEEIILEPAVLTTRAMEYRRNDITIFFLGKASSYDNIEKAIDIYGRMTGYLGTDKYIVVGPIVGDLKKIEAVNAALESKFGDKFLNLYNYLLNEAHTENSLTLSAKAKENINKGILPENYFEGNNHFNKLGAEIAGNKITEKLNELEYVD